MSPRKGALRSLSAAGGVWALNIAIVLACAGLLAGPVRDLPGFDVGVHIPWWGLALGFLAAERCVVHLHFRRSAHSFSLGDLPLVFGLLFATPMNLVLAGLIGPIVVLLFDRRLPAIKIVFNIAQFTLTTCLAVIIFRQLASTVEGFGPMTWIFALLATQASAIITVTLIGAAISLSEGLIGAKALGRMLVMDLTVTTTNASLGLAGAVIVAYDIRALPLLVVPLVTVFLAYRAYATERQRHESLEFLYETTRTLSRSPEIVVALEGLLARSVEAFRAEIAEIVLFPAEGNAPLRTTLGPGDARDVMQPVDPEIADELRALVDHEEPVARVTPASGSLRLRRYLEERGVTHAMLAMLPGETRVVGTMLLANRPGVVRDFSDADLRLFETLATNASVALAVTMPSSSNILERLRWKVVLGLVIVAAGFAAQAAPSGAPGHEVARSSWGAAAEASDVARSSWGIMADPTEGRPNLGVAAPSAEPTDVARSSWGKMAESTDDEA